MHDDVGASLSNINILNELARRNANNPIKANEYLSKAGEDIQQVSESLSDIVWNINSRYDDLENIFVRMKRYASDMFDGKNINYIIDFPSDTKNLELSMDKRKDFYFIFKESINNIIKYADATDAKVSINIHYQDLELHISDNGKGFAKEKIQLGNGLLNMRQRASLSKAEFNIKTTEGEGTSVYLKMKLH